jgi:molecular chaperone DnaK
VALGAAIQGGVLGGEVSDLLLLDVSPLSLGIETLGGVTTVLIERNTTIPTRKSEVFTTAADNQPSVEVHVLQGEREMAKDNRTLGRFHLEGIPAARRGVPQVDVTFDIDANGILHVTAKDLGTNKEQKITVTSSSGLSDSEIDGMVNDANAHASEDKDRREQIEARNHLDSLVYQTDKMLNENRENLDGKSISAVESAVADGRKVLEQEGASTDELKQAHETLQHASHQLAQTMYQQASAPEAEAGSDGTTEEEGEVIEAEVVEEDSDAS